MAFRSEAGRQLPHENLRFLKAAHLFEGMDAGLKDLVNRQIAKLEEQIEQVIATDAALAETSAILRPIPGSARSPARC